MKLSLYTIVKNGIYNDLHVEAMIRHHLPLFDEIVVNDGYSTDGTFESISSIDPKVHVFREQWDAGDKSGALFAQAKNKARVRCTGDWCVLLDCDEFIPEWEFERMRRELEATDKVIVPLRFLQFYGSYRVMHGDPAKVRWPAYKYPIHLNRPDIVVVGDGANVEFVDQPISFPVKLPPPGGSSAAVAWHLSFECHHMGQVRDAGRLRQKWRVQSKLKQANPKLDKTPGFVFDLAPHDWFDADFLPDLVIYDGPHVKAVLDDPDEFVRDEMKLLHYLQNRKQAP